MLIVKDITKIFNKTAKNGEKINFYSNNKISFAIEKGKIIGILGPNGAGKTTLLRIIGGILKPNSGTVLFDELDYIKNEIDIKKQIAYLSGNTKIYNTLSCYELLKICASFYKVSLTVLEKRIEKITTRLNIGDFLQSKIGNLSTGRFKKSI